LADLESSDAAACNEVKVNDHGPFNALASKVKKAFWEVKGKLLSERFCRFSKE
jgi:hypothetical protein